MKYDLSIIIAHYNPSDKNDIINPLIKTIESINSQKNNHKIEIIIADDGSAYTNDLIEYYSTKKITDKDKKYIYTLNGDKLSSWLSKKNINSDLINGWVYFPKYTGSMSKARVVNKCIDLSSSDKLCFLDDDNYFISKNSIENILKLFDNYNLIIGQIQDNNKKYRSYNSYRVQGTTIAVNKKIIENIGGFGEWTEEFSCGIDSDLWIKLYNHFIANDDLKACYTNKFSTYDSYSKRWKKYTKFFKEFRLRQKFNKIYGCKNYKNHKYNLSRQKQLWIENLIEKK